MIKIITDSTAYTPKDYALAHDITVVPLRVLYKDTEFDEGYPGEYDAFYEDFCKTKIFPKTSQPSLETFINYYNNAIDHGDEVLVFTISSTLSGTNSVANLAREQCKSPEKVFVIDSLSNVQTILGMIMEAVEMRDAGKSITEIIEKVEQIKLNCAVHFIPDSLEYLAKGGRIGKVTATIGSLFQVKPILTYKQGELTSKKSFGIQKAIKDMLAGIPQKIKKLFVLHIACTKFFDLLKKFVGQWLLKRPDKDKIEVFEGEVGPVNACHIGPAIGVAWIGAED